MLQRRMRHTRPFPVCFSPFVCAPKRSRDSPVTHTHTVAQFLSFFCAFLCFASFQTPVTPLTWLLLYFIHHQLPVISAHMCSFVCQYFYFLRTLFYSYVNSDAHTASSPPTSYIVRLHSLLLERRQGTR